MAEKAGVMKSFPYVSPFRDNRGKIRHRFRKGAVSRYLSGEPGSSAFLEGYTAALSEAEAKTGLSQKAPPAGSLSALLALYYASPAYLKLRASTQSTYRKILNPLAEEWGALPVKDLPPEWIEGEIAKRMGTPGMANRFFRNLRMVLAFGVRKKWLASNPCSRVDWRVEYGEGFKEWPDALIEQYQDFWPVGSKPRLALDLLLYTGQRRSDVVTMSKSHVRGAEIRVVQQKTGAALWIPIHPKLQTSIAETPSKGITFLCTEYGKPFTSNGFGNWFRDKANRAKIPTGYSAHGLRKAAGRRLADAGCTAHQIMAVLGHTSMKEAERYTRGADQRKNAQAAIRRVK